MRPLVGVVLRAMVLLGTLVFLLLGHAAQGRGTADAEVRPVLSAGGWDSWGGKASGFMHGGLWHEHEA